MTNCGQNLKKIKLETLITNPGPGVLDLNRYLS